jgi:hypothetical protein
MQKDEFKFSEDLRDAVIDALVDRIKNALQNDEDTLLSFVEVGFPGVSQMDGNELMDEYMNWNGTFSLEENPDDVLLRRMFEEQDNYSFEKEVLNEEQITNS